MVSTLEQHLHVVLWLHIEAHTHKQMQKENLATVKELELWAGPQTLGKLILSSRLNHWVFTKCSLKWLIFTSCSSLRRTTCCTNISINSSNSDSVHCVYGTQKYLKTNGPFMMWMQVDLLSLLLLPLSSVCQTLPRVRHSPATPAIVNLKLCGKGLVFSWILKTFTNPLNQWIGITFSSEEWGFTD